MYIALGLMLAGILAGRLLRGKLPLLLLRHCIMAAIFLLLFVLGIAIGSNAELFANLPRLGATAALLTIFALAGSIAAAVALKRLFPGLRAMDGNPDKH